MRRTLKDNRHGGLAVRGGWIGRFRLGDKPALWAVVVLVLGVASVAWADELVVGGVTQEGVRVTGVQRDLLLYETAQGRRRQVGLSAVEEIRLSRYPAVGEAEALSQAGDFAEAAEKYAEAVGAMPDGDLKVLMRAKLVASLESAGELARAVEAFVSLMGDDHSPVAQAARPRTLPTDSATREQLAELVRERVNRAADAVARRALQQLLNDLEADPEEVDEREQDMRPQLVGPRQRRDATRTDPIDQLLESGRYREAVTAIDDALERGNGTVARRLYQRGVAKAELGDTREAALCFMRVVIHFPTSRNPFYVPSLVEAARMFVELDQPEHARRLLQEAREAGAAASQLEDVEALLGSKP